MDLKLMFLLVAFIAISYRTEVNTDSDYFATCVCRTFFVSKDKLYDFVTTSNMVGRWVDWMPEFMSADQKPLGVGKWYRTDSLKDAILFKVTDFHEGNYVAVESNFHLRPRIEFYFFEIDSHHISGNCSWHLKSSQLEIRLTLKRSSALFQDNQFHNVYT